MLPRFSGAIERFRDIIKCDYCSRTFDNVKSRKYAIIVLSKFLHWTLTDRASRHHKTHVRPYACKSCGRKFALKADQERHSISQHRSDMFPPFKCKWPGCIHWVFKRSDQLWRHWRLAHAKGENAIRLFADLKTSYRQSVEEQRSEVNSSVLIAVETNNLSMVQLLVSNGANVNSLSKTGQSALCIAARQKSFQLVELLLQFEADIHQHTVTHEDRNWSVVEPGVWKGAESYRPLEIIKHQIDLSNGDPLALTIDSQLHQDSKHKFYPANVDPDYNLDLELVIASFSGHKEIVRLLLTAGAKTDGRGQASCYAIQAAAYNGHDSIVALLLEYGANINQSSDEFGPSLQLATQGDHLATVRLLIEKTSWAGGSRLHHAVLHGNTGLVKVLIKVGANVNSRIRNDKTALMAALKLGSADIVRILLENGADVDAWDSENNVSLDLAFCSGVKSLWQLLIEFGAGQELCVDCGI